jgi:hypothetical protein
MNIESATLVLRTSSINTTVGDVNANGFNNDVTWNINLQQCLGSMYSKYRRFKLCITSVGCGTPGTTLSDNNRLLNVNIEGFQWVNASYNYMSGTMDRNVIASTITAGTTSGFSNNFTGEVGFVFNKPSSSDVRVRIYLTRISDNTIVPIQYPNFCYCFSIYGINE